jgi:hypothetical protein
MPTSQGRAKASGIVTQYYPVNGHGDLAFGIAANGDR